VSIIANNTKDIILIDEEDYILYSIYDISVYINPGGYKHARFTSGPYSKLVLARVIMNAPPELEVDHRDRDSLNCRKNNMRLATIQQQSYNRLIKTRKEKLPKGVYRVGTRFRAQITWMGARTNLGYYDTVEEAETVYKKFAKLFFGEFADN
jgi:hypothetical protein